MLQHKRKRSSHFIFTLCIGLLYLTHCAQTNSENINSLGKPFSVYIDKALPEEISLVVRQASSQTDNALFVITENPSDADIKIVPGRVNDGIEIGKWFYAACVPFYTVRDTISLTELEKLWKTGTNGKDVLKRLILDKETAQILTNILGQGKAELVEPKKLIDDLFAQKSSITITPFHRLLPCLKVLDFDGFHILERGANLNEYPLVFHISASGKKEEIHCLKKIIGDALNNRNESKMTTVVMTGTTALTRQTAYIMEKYGIEFPASSIKNWLTDADVTHISNEVSFFPECVLNNTTGNMKFCSNEKYLSLFDSIGVDVIELSGNHLTDFGTAPLLHTLDLFEQKKYRWYAGGRDLEDAMKPVYIISGPNRIAFLGACAGPSYYFASKTSPGPLKADWKMLQKEINELVTNNWLPIVTIQYTETYEYFPTISQISSFRFLADAGAVIVQGSQAHQPQSFDFRNNAFIHYGLGNLFFDQMWSLGTRQEFIDRHIFYNGRHISTVLQTAMLEDYARPRPMTDQERAELLNSTFSQSFWKDNKY